MLSRSNFVIGLVLLVAAIAVFIGIGRFAVPRLLNDATSLAVQSDCAVMPCESAETVAQVTSPTTPPTNTPQPPTATSTPSPTAPPATATTEAITPTETTLPTAQPSPTNTALPTEPPPPTEPPTAVPTATPDGPTPTPDAPLFTATRDAALFAEVGGLGGRTGYYVPTGQTAWVLGRSEDLRWLHVAHLLGDQGWAAAGFFSATRSQLVALPVSDFVGEGDPNVTVRATQVAQLIATPTPRPQFATPRPVNTPWPTNTPRPSIAARATNTPWPTSTPRTVNAPRATATWVIPTPVPTNTQLPNGGGSGSANGATTNAVAWWRPDRPTILSNGNGTWRANLIIRVPTSFTYSFNMPFLTTQRLRERNLDGDDYFLLTISGMPCGSPLNTELIALQNGARMLIFSDETFQQGPVVISSPC